MQPRRDLFVFQTIFDARQIALHDRSHIIVHHRGDGAVVFAKFRQDVGGQRHRNIGEALGDDVAQLLLVIRIGVGVHQRNGERLDA